MKRAAVALTRRCCAAFIFIAVLSMPVVAQTLPDSPGAEVVRARCVTCHEADLIVQQRLTRGGWEREVDKMVRWGALVSSSERGPMLDYLARHFFATRPAASQQLPDTASAGQATYRRTCLTCHEGDLVEQQRLTKAGWTREVEKMVRWGAPVPAAEKDGLVDFLTARHGPPSQR